MTLQLLLAWRYLSGRKLRTFLTTLAIVFGVLVIFGMNIILPTMVSALQANVQGMAGVVDFSVTLVSGESFSPEIVHAVEGVDGVRAVSATLIRTVNLPVGFFGEATAQTAAITAVNLIGLDPQAARSVRAYPVTDGRFLEPADAAAAVISQSLADKLRIGVGGSFPLPTTQGLADLTVVGILPPRTTPGNEEILVTLAQAQRMTNEPGRINTVDINIETGAGEARRTEIQKAVEAAIGSNYHVGTLMSGTDMFAALQLGQAILGLFGLLALFMGGFIIFNTFRTIVAERRRDIGMLRALGATRGTILGMILAEGILQGVIGAGLGLVFGYLLGAGLLKLVEPFLSRFLNLNLGSPVVSPGLVVVCVLLGVTVTLLAGLIPARNASRVMPLEALRPVQAETDLIRNIGAGSVIGIVILIATSLALFSGDALLITPSGFLFLIGLVLVAPLLVRPFTWVLARVLGWIFARSGIGELAQGNLIRQPARTAVTASATMLGLAVIVAAGGMIASISVVMYDVMRKSLGSDYLFIPPSVSVWNTNLGAGPDFVDRLRGVEGAGEISTFRFAGTKVNGVGVSLLGIDPAAFPNVSGLYFLQGGEGAYRELAAGRNMIVNSSFLSIASAKVGDTVDLLTPNGPVPYRIVAAATDLLNVKVNTAFISQANMEADFGKTEDVFLQMNLAPGADRAAADAQIKEIAADYPQFQLISGREYYDTMKGQFEAAFSAVYVLFGLLAFPSFIAMLNTLAIGVIERTREIGMIRAVGATRGQIGAMVTAEALLLAAIGTAFGIVGGWYLGYTFISAMKAVFPMGYAFPAAGMLAAAVFGLLFGVLAAVIPARQAAKLDIIRALQYE
ncbi:MAG: FtsX-like permease family protein [Anaerolineales bacterium]|nr:FtsX-like permease family protein [Anaerolineales bacterium]